MNDVIEKLLVIQDRDSRIHKLATEKSRIPLEIQHLNDRIAATRAQVDAAKSKAKECEKDQKKIDVDVEAKRQTVNKFKTQILTIKKNEELHALQHEIKAIETEIRALEDRELELMEKLEGYKKIIQTEEAACKTTVAQLQAQIADLEKRSKLIDEQLSELEKNRSELAKDADPATLSFYERIMKSKKDAAIVAINGGICQGCHMKLTSQVVHDVKAGKVIHCTNCGRMLYWHSEMGD